MFENIQSKTNHSFDCHSDSVLQYIFDFKLIQKKTHCSFKEQIQKNIKKETTKKKTSMIINTRMILFCKKEVYMVIMNVSIMYRISIEIPDVMINNEDPD